MSTAGLMGRQQRHRKARFKSKRKDAEDRDATAAILAQQQEQHARLAQQALSAGLAPPPPPPPAKPKRRQHHTKDGSLRNHRVRGARRPARGGRGGATAGPGEGTEKKKSGDGDGEEDGSQSDEPSGDAEKKEDGDESSDYSGSSTEDDGPPIDAAVYAFVPPSSALSTAPAQSAASSAAAAMGRPTAPRPTPPPPSLRDQSLLVVAQQSARGGDELDRLLSMHDDTPIIRTTAVAPPVRPSSKAAVDLSALESDLDSLLGLG